MRKKDRYDTADLEEDPFEPGSHRRVFKHNGVGSRFKAVLIPAIPETQPLRYSRRGSVTSVGWSQRLSRLMCSPTARRAPVHIALVTGLTWMAGRRYGERRLQTERYLVCS